MKIKRFIILSKNIKKGIDKDKYVSYNTKAL